MYMLKVSVLNTFRVNMIGLLTQTGTFMQMLFPGINSIKNQVNFFKSIFEVCFSQNFILLLLGL